MPQFSKNWLGLVKITQNLLNQIKSNLDQIEKKNLL